MLQTNIKGNEFNIKVNIDNITIEGLTYSDKYKRYYLNTNIRTLKGTNCNISFKVYLSEEQFNKLFNIKTQTNKQTQTNVDITNIDEQTLQTLQTLILQTLKGTQTQTTNKRTRKKVSE